MGRFNRSLHLVPEKYALYARAYFLLVLEACRALFRVLEAESVSTLDMPCTLGPRSCRSPHGDQPTQARPRAGGSHRGLDTPQRGAAWRAQSGRHARGRRRRRPEQYAAPVASLPRHPHTRVWGGGLQPTSTRGDSASQQRRRSPNPACHSVPAGGRSDTCRRGRCTRGLGGFAAARPRRAQCSGSMGTHGAGRHRRVELPARSGGGGGDDGAESPWCIWSDHAGRSSLLYLCDAMAGEW